LRGLDTFVINEGEARELTGTSNLILESQRLLEKVPAMTSSSPVDWVRCFSKVK
jgi:hypothetical protein